MKFGFSIYPNQTSNNQLLRGPNNHILNVDKPCYRSLIKAHVGLKIQVPVVDVAHKYNKPLLEILGALKFKNRGRYDPQYVTSWTT